MTGECKRRRVNPESNPEAMGLKIIDILENSSHHDFDTHMVWRHQDGTFYWGHDSGCSCPTPFEDYQIGDGLLELTDFPSFSDMIMNYEGKSTMGERMKFLQEVEKELSRYFDIKGGVLKPKTSGACPACPSERDSAPSSHPACGPSEP